MSITHTQAEKNLKQLLNSYKPETFIFDLLRAYGLPKASITRLENGDYNLSKNEGEVSWKKQVLYKAYQNADLYHEVSEMEKRAQHDQRFIVATDFKDLLSIDTKTKDKLNIPFEELPKHYDFFLPWAGMEKAQVMHENPADVKAAGRMAKLFDEIKKDNPDTSEQFIHGLNVFLSRLLFAVCNRGALKLLRR